MKLTWKSITAIIIGVASITILLFADQLLPGIMNSPATSLSGGFLLLFAVPSSLMLLYTAYGVIKINNIHKISIASGESVILLATMLFVCYCLTAWIPVVLYENGIFPSI
jgi:hypothetical protein